MSVRRDGTLYFRGGPADDGEYDVDEMRAKLADLKQTGTTVLVTGTVGEHTAAYASRSLFGAPDAAPARKRILALTDESRAQSAAHFPKSEPSARNWVIDLQEQERSTPATASPNRSRFDHEADSLTTLRTELRDAIDWFTRDGVKPAELRVGVDSLSYLLEEYEFAEVERLVASISARVEVDNGMCHFIYQHDPDANSETVEKLMAHCDVEIRLRKRNGKPAEQRWRVPEIGTTLWYKL